MGIRAEESVKRSRREQIRFVPSVRSFHFKPIFEWTEWHVWEFIDKYELPYLSLYDQGFSRVGCIVCPFICGNLKKIEMHRQIAPGIYKAFEHAVNAWFNSPDRKGYKKLQEKTAEEFLKNWYGGEVQ